MATLVFSAVGTALGGPVGGAIGTLFGRQFDTAILGSPHREGARLKELEVTTSSYGQPIPRHFGRMRVAGQMIWATELIESTDTLGGGKNSAAITTYSYSASFAVALASRPILDIGRIWADGRLLRGTDGLLKSGGLLRVHKGHADQACDPLMLAAEGADLCPAHRDLAYVVFEDLDLSDFYNRIPALTFEVFADEGFDLSDVVGDLVPDADAAVPLAGFHGLTCDGPLTGLLQTIDQVIPLDINAGGERPVIAPQRRQSQPIALPEAAISAEDGDFGIRSGFSRQRAAPEERPVSILRYFDSDRDYLPGLQHASGRASPGSPRAIELPAALGADTARSLIERTRRRIDWSRERLSWRMSALDPAVTPGAIVSFPGIPGEWRVLEWEWRDSGVEISAERMAPASADAPAPAGADPGRINAPLDLPPPPTTLAAFELPHDPAHVFAAVSSPGAHWSGAALLADRGDGELHPLGPSGRRRAVMGRTTTGLASMSPLLFDRVSSLDVMLVDPAMQLSSGTIRELAEGVNLALVGEEIVQFARATALGGGAWRLEGFLRGRGSTPAGSHRPGASFVLLDRAAVPLDSAALGSAETRKVAALGRGDGDPVLAPIALNGISLRPPAPVHPRAAFLADGTLKLQWTRRARGERVWQDGIDVPLVEQSESYLLTYGPPDRPVATWTLPSPVILLPAAEQAQLTVLSPGEVFRVRQLGTHALSDALRLFQLP